MYHPLTQTAQRGKVSNQGSQGSAKASQPKAQPEGTTKAPPKGPPPARPQATPKAPPKGPPSARPQGTAQAPPKGPPPAPPQGTPKKRPKGPKAPPKGAPPARSKYGRSAPEYQAILKEALAKGGPDFQHAMANLKHLTYEQRQDLIDKVKAHYPDIKLSSELPPSPPLRPLSIARPLSITRPLDRPLHPLKYLNTATLPSTTPVGWPHVIDIETFKGSDMTFLTAADGVGTVLYHYQLGKLREMLNVEKTKRFEWTRTETSAYGAGMVCETKDRERRMISVIRTGRDVVFGFSNLHEYTKAVMYTILPSGKWVPKSVTHPRLRPAADPNAPPKTSSASTCMDPCCRAHAANLKAQSEMEMKAEGEGEVEGFGETLEMDAAVENVMEEALMEAIKGKGKERVVAAEDEVEDEAEYEAEIGAEEEDEAEYEGEDEDDPPPPQEGAQRPMKQGWSSDEHWVDSVGREISMHMILWRKWEKCKMARMSVYTQ